LSIAATRDDNERFRASDGYHPHDPLVDVRVILRYLESPLFEILQPERAGVVGQTYCPMVVSVEVV